MHRDWKIPGLKPLNFTAIFTGLKAGASTKTLDFLFIRHCLKSDVFQLFVTSFDFAQDRLLKLCPDMNRS